MTCQYDTNPELRAITFTPETEGKQVYPSIRKSGYPQNHKLCHGFHHIRAGEDMIACILPYPEMILTLSAGKSTQTVLYIYLVNPFNNLE